MVCFQYLTVNYIINADTKAVYTTVMGKFKKFGEFKQLNTVT